VINGRAAEGPFLRARGGRGPSPLNPIPGVASDPGLCIVPRCRACRFGFPGLRRSEADRSSCHGIPGTCRTASTRTRANLLGRIGTVTSALRPCTSLRAGRRRGARPAPIIQRDGAEHPGGGHNRVIHGHCAGFQLPSGDLVHRAGALHDNQWGHCAFQLVANEWRGHVLDDGICGCRDAPSSDGYGHPRLGKYRHLDLHLRQRALGPHGRGHEQQFRYGRSIAHRHRHGG